MPYENVKNLPESVKRVLPHHAQEIYLAVYNNAHKQYFKKKDRRHPDDSLEEICHRVAWAAVKEKYNKNERGDWVPQK